MTAGVRTSLRQRRGGTLRRVLVACVLGIVGVAGARLVGASNRVGTVAVAGSGPVAIVVRDGAVAGGAQILDVAPGQHVVLDVTADRVDAIHVHGYDVMRRTRPGKAVEVSFDATIPGEFDVELETLRLQLARVRVG